MKLDAITVAAVAVAGLAVVTWARNRSAGSTPTGPIMGGVVDYYGMLTAQRRENGAALSQNTDYLRNWQALGAATASQPDWWI